MTTHRTRGVVLFAVLALALTGCSGGNRRESPAREKSSPSRADSSSAAPSAPPSPSPSSSPSASPSSSSPGGTPALASYYGQTLSWSPCRDSFRCARMRVPLDYAKPAGRSIEIALLKLPASGPRRLGTMVVDPGGPGASGVEYAAGAATSFGTALRRHYDIVGLDPRGVGDSEGVRCLPDARMNALLASDQDPDNAAEVRHLRHELRSLGRGCVRRNGALASHLSTVEVARDLDVVRATVGDRRLSYFGASYGTAIGAEYAALFPRRVGRMVLDGAVDPAQSTLDVNLVQAKGFETALRAYVGACVTRSDCVLGSTVDQGVRRIQQFLRQVDGHSLPAGKRTLRIGDAQYAISGALYSKNFWPVLDAGLRNAFQGDGTVMMLLADSYLRRNEDGSFQGNLYQAFFAVTCLDEDDPVRFSDLTRYRARFEEASPTFGRTFLYGTTSCIDWPVHSRTPLNRVHVTRAAPILVVGTTRDPATPLVSAKSLARQLGRSVLVTRDGDGHTGYHQGSACVDAVVERYFVSGTVPRRDVRCS